jgi:glycosyltransferase involved in cell wall biosynthesis
VKLALYARRLGKPWGAQFLPEILSALPEDVHMLIAGEGPLRSQLEEEFRARGVAPRVIFLGAVPQSELYTLLAIADVFLFPSHSEGLAHGLLEALAAGCPPVVFAVGGNIPLLERELSALLVAPHDTALFAQKVSEVLHYDTDTRAALLAKMHHAVLDYDKENVLPKLKDVLLGSITTNSI